MSLLPTALASPDGPTSPSPSGPFWFEDTSTYTVPASVLETTVLGAASTIHFGGLVVLCFIIGLWFIVMPIIRCWAERCAKRPQDEEMSSSRLSARDATWAFIYKGIPCEKEGIAWKRSPIKKLRALFAHIFSFPLHLMRCLHNARSNGLLASVQERDFLTSADRQVFDDKLIDFFVIRRSMIIATWFFLLIQAAMAAGNILMVFSGRLRWQREAAFSVDGQDITWNMFRQMHPERNWGEGDIAGWSVYARRLQRAIIGRLMASKLIVDLVAEIFAFLLTFVGLFLLWRAVLRWHAFTRSRDLVLMGWMCATLCPFMMTLIPSGNFIDTKPAWSLALTFAKEFSEVIGDDGSAEYMVRTCRKIVLIENTDGVEKVEKLLIRYCKAIKMTPNRHVKCCSWFPLVDQDFTRFHDGCKDVKKKLTTKDAEQRQAAVSNTAKMCTKFILPSNITDDAAIRGQGLVYLANMEPLARRVQETVVVLLSASQGLHHFHLIMPLSLALAPALLRGALKVKVAAPQSTLPGMFIMLLPWLYCPMLWGMYNIYLQLVGDFLMLIGMAAIAFSPMIYCYIGYMKNITRPLNDEKVEELANDLGWYRRTFLSVGYVCLGLFLARRTITVSDEYHTVEEEAWVWGLRIIRSYMKPGYLTNLTVNIITKYFFSTLAAVDWMMSSIAKQRHYEMLLTMAEQTKQAGLTEEQLATMDLPEGFRTPEERKELFEVVEERHGRLDCVSWVLFNHWPVHIEDQEEGSFDHSCSSGSHATAGTRCRTAASYSGDSSVTAYGAQTPLTEGAAGWPTDHDRTAQGRAAIQAALERAHRKARNQDRHQLKYQGWRPMASSNGRSAAPAAAASRQRDTAQYFGSTASSSSRAPPSGVRGIASKGRGRGGRPPRPPSEAVSGGTGWTSNVSSMTNWQA
eukprot:TRINITY_DN41943_c0_g1_i1.p1 TRINITY_DN41943_c0_g1~~TRINITY_DN41943_c0_g1_i1.p1  ORF type:complete len:913 (-),score=146.75 TRINITY_DN41943_c0_g1_i1:140-2878(-)